MAKNGENIVYRSDVESLGIGALIIKGYSGEHPLKTWDKIMINYTGTPQKDIIISITEEDFNTISRAIMEG